jgi:hypothetical protein
MEDEGKGSGLTCSTLSLASCRYPLAQLPEIEAHASLNQYGPELAKHWSTELRTRVIQVNKMKTSSVEPFSGLYWRIESV